MEQRHNARTSNTFTLTEIAILAALLIVMSFTPLGYLRIGIVSITFLMLPVMMGAITVGPTGGAILGAVFGLTSLAQCFGMDAFGTTFFQLNPFGMTLVCLPTRILAGYLAGWLFSTWHRRSPATLLPYAGTSVCASLLNTVLFVGTLVAFFGRSEELHQYGDSLPKILWTLTGINAIVELVVCTIVGTALAKGLHRFFEKRYRD